MFARLLALRKNVTATPIAAFSRYQSTQLVLKRSVTPIMYPNKDEVIPIFPRVRVGSLNAQYARRRGYVSGLIYGGTGNKTIRIYTMEHNIREIINRRGRTFLNTVFQVEIDGKMERVIPRDLHMHPVKDKVISINFVRFRPDRFPGTIADIPIRLFNEEKCYAYKEGGWAFILAKKVRVHAIGDKIPSYIFVDARNKYINDIVYASEIDLPPGVHYHRSGQDFPIVKFMAPRKGDMSMTKAQRAAMKAAHLQAEANEYAAELEREAQAAALAERRAAAAETSVSSESSTPLQ